MVIISHTITVDAALVRHLPKDTVRPGYDTCDRTQTEQLRRLLPLWPGAAVHAFPQKVSHNVHATASDLDRDLVASMTRPPSVRGNRLHAYSISDKSSIKGIIAFCSSLVHRSASLLT